MNMVGEEPQRCSNVVMHISETRLFWTLWSSLVISPIKYDGKRIDLNIGDKSDWDIGQ